MPLRVVSGVGRGMGEGGDRRKRRGSFRGEFGASHCNQRRLLRCARATRSSQITLGRNVLLVFLADYI